MERIFKKISIFSWVLAARPKTLTAGVLPVFVGTLLSDFSLSAIDWWVAFCALMCSISIQIATNLINDALDFKKGADTKERLGPVRVTQAGILRADQVLKGAFVCFVVALLFSIPLITKGGMLILALVIASIFCSYIYTGGPYPLAYVGLGELFVILFYGLLGTSVSYYLQTGNWGGTMLWSIALQLGLLITLLLAINNLRDCKEDRKSKKMTLVARFGIEFARKEILLLITLPYVMNFLWLFNGYSLLFIFPLVAAPMALNILKNIFQTEPGKIYNRFLGDASLFILAYSILIILGFRIGS